MCWKEINCFDLWFKMLGKNQNMNITSFVCDINILSAWPLFSSFLFYFESFQRCFNVVMRYFLEMFNVAMTVIKFRNVDPIWNPMLNVTLDNKKTRSGTSLERTKTKNILPGRLSYSLHVQNMINILYQEHSLFQLRISPMVSINFSLDNIEETV